MMELYNERHPRARKVHTCEACRREIQPGEVYCRQTGLWESDFFSRAWCPDCELVMSYFFDRLSAEDVFDYDEVEYAIQDEFCYNCDHGQRREDNCEEKSIWHCPIIQKGCAGFYEQQKTYYVDKESHL